VSRTPPRFVSAKIADLDSEQMRIPLEYWASAASNAKKGIGLLLSGPNGCGKTYALAAFTNALTKIDSEFANATKALTRYMSFDGKEWDETRNQSFDCTLETVDWLVLDDLGKEYRGGKLQEQMTFRLGALLRARSENLKITHISTNIYPAKGVREIYGDSIASLLLEMCKIVEITGLDRRANGRKKA
jgi:DNA replication protein DnaC